MSGRQSADWRELRSHSHILHGNGQPFAWVAFLPKFWRQAK